MAEEPQSYAGFVGIIAAVVGIIIMRLRPPGLGKLWEAIEKIRDTISGKDGLMERTTRTETVIELFKGYVADALHSPHTPELDVILEKISAKIPLTKEDKEKCRELITKIKQDPSIPKNEKIGYAFILSDCEADLLLRK